MTRLYACDHLDCELAMDDPFITVGYRVVGDDGEDGDDEYEEAHFCSWVCHAAWSVVMAMAAKD